MRKPQVAVIVGSIRRESLNGKLAKALARIGADRCDFVPVRIDELPLFNQDHESAPPAAVAQLKDVVKGADALLFVTPEHNRSIPAALKNAIDWGSRPYGQGVWARKPAAITGTSAGSLGTYSAQHHLRHILTVLGVVVMGQPETYVVFKPGMIGDDGSVNDDSTTNHLQSFMDRFTDWIARNAP